jgi:hypothetical protein
VIYIQENQMTRIAVCSLAVCLAIPLPATRADEFDHYDNTVLSKVPEFGGAMRISELTPDLLIKYRDVLPNTSALFVVVRTNEGRYCKLLVQPARQRVSAEKSIPILLVDRFITYREGEEKAVEVRGSNVRLFDGFRLSLDLGQVVPESLGGDIRFVAARERAFAEPVGKAEMYLMTKPMPEAAPKKLPKVVIGKAFETRYFAGKYALHDDGRRSGTLVLDVNDNKQVSGSFYSAKDGTKYEVNGKVGAARHEITFAISFPRSVMTYHGWMFTGDGRAIAGSSRLQDRETGFYALRDES